MKVKNLKGCLFPDRKMVEKDIDTLAASADNDAEKLKLPVSYLLSMPLYASAQLGDGKRYREILPRMKAAMDKFPEGSFKVWLQGRMLLSADSIGDQKTKEETLSKMKAFLGDEKSADDEFSAWSWGYLGSLDNTQYKFAEKKMKSTGDALTAKYQSVISAKDTQDPKVIQEARSNALWAWIMNLQAAARAGDKTRYNYCLGQIKIVAGDKKNNCGCIDDRIAKVVHLE